MSYRAIGNAILAGILAVFLTLSVHAEEAAQTDIGTID